MWLPAMIVSELAPWFFLLRIGVAALFIRAGALDLGIGQAGLILFLLSELGLLLLIRRTLQAASDTGLKVGLTGIWRVTISPPPNVIVEEDVAYSDGLTMNLYRRVDTDNAPALVYIHPGSWMRGRPGRQARPALYELASKGWVILDIRYPLSPAATFPDHLIGTKRAIAWAKSEGARLGINPEQVAVAGGSSGAHLAALTALTWDHEDLQPGFEAANTRVVACVPHYGIYDLLVRNGTRYDWPFIAKYVMKTQPHEDPDLYRLGSPIDLVRPDAPPFLVIHGEFDSIVLPAESEHFVEALHETEASVRYHEVAGGQHGFDAIASARTRGVARIFVDFLEDVVNGTAMSDRLPDH